MIDFKNITLSFNEKVIIDNFNLYIKRGDKILLDVPSGKGKSSLLKMILGFITPDSGYISVDGIPQNKKTIDEIRKKISWVNQDITFRKVQVIELLKEINLYDSNSNKDIFKDLNRVLSDFGLNEDILEKNVEKLSGGERQRLGFVITILLDRDILLLDEVTSSLDITLKKKVEEWIKTSNKTIILSSHDTHWDKSIFKVVRW